MDGKNEERSEAVKAILFDKARRRIMQLVKGQGNVKRLQMLTDETGLWSTSREQKEGRKLCVFESKRVCVRALLNPGSQVQFSVTSPKLYPLLFPRRKV
jgi:hypothetical protein